MSRDYGASHDFWKHGKMKRRSKEKNPYSITVKVGEKDMDRIEFIRSYYGKEISGVSWENMSMLIRQIILFESCRIEDLMVEKQKKSEDQRNEIAIKV